MSQASSSSEITRAVVMSIDHGVATILVGDQQEEWDFPLDLLPEGTGEDSIVLMSGEGYSLRAVGLAPERVDSVQSRLNRGVNRRRLAHIA